MLVTVIICFQNSIYLTYLHINLFSHFLLYEKTFIRKGDQDAAQGSYKDLSHGNKPLQHRKKIHFDYID